MKFIATSTPNSRCGSVAILDGRHLDGRHLDGRHLDGAAANVNGVARDRHLVREATVHTVEALQLMFRSKTEYEFNRVLSRGSAFRISS